MGAPRELYQSYIASGAWDVKRWQRMKIDRYGCVLCRLMPSEHTAPIVLQVHHLRYDNLGDEPMEDLVTLCKEDHRLVHWWMEVTQLKPEAGEDLAVFIERMRPRFHAWLNGCIRQAP